MTFLRANIDRAIVMTQYDLRGFSHPFGMRVPPGNPKSLYSVTANFMVFAAGMGKKARGTNKSYVDFFNSSFEDYLAMCKQLALDCDNSELEAIRLIVEEIIKQHRGIGAAIASMKQETSGYYKPISKDNELGRAILALQEVFCSTKNKKNKKA